MCRAWLRRLLSSAIKPPPAREYFLTNEVFECQYQKYYDEQAPFEGNGSAKEFAFHFKVFTGDQIAVYVSASDDSDVLLENGFSVELNEDQEVLPGGTVLFDRAAFPRGRRLSVLSNVPYDQPHGFGPIRAVSIRTTVNNRRRSS